MVNEVISDKKSAIEIDSSFFWREEIGNRNRLVILAADDDDDDDDAIIVVLI